MPVSLADNCRLNYLAARTIAVMKKIWPARLLAVLTVAVAFSLLAGSAAAHPSATGGPALLPGTRYLALGDSVTFGYKESTVVPKPDYRDQGSFLGYPEHLAASTGAIVTNPSCPGETTASLINDTAQSNGCENTPKGPVGYRTLFPLHVKYKGSQLAFALAFLHAHGNVRLVSLMIGANDLFICEETTADACAGTAERTAVLRRITHNVHRILAAIRNKAHYRGRLVIVNYYSLNSASAAVTGFSKALNAAQDAGAAPFHVTFANGYGEFQRATQDFAGDTCAAGLLTQWLTPKVACGVHPSFAGQALLAEAVLRAARR
jgi:lysophospholipase L1-like esterase